jgi:hypothetical protein
VTAAELYELVKDCPEVWPARLEFIVYASADGEWICPDSGGFVTSIPDDYAADLILAGVVRKLLSLGSIESYYGATDLIVVEVEGADELWAQGTGPTLLSAALAAYRKAKP